MGIDRQKKNFEKQKEIILFGVLEVYLLLQQLTNNKKKR